VCVREGWGERCHRSFVRPSQRQRPSPLLPFSLSPLSLPFLAVDDARDDIFPQKSFTSCPLTNCFRTVLLFRLTFVSLYDIRDRFGIRKPCPRHGRKRECDKARGETSTGIINHVMIVSREKSNPLRHAISRLRVLGSCASVSSR